MINEGKFVEYLPQSFSDSGFLDAKGRLLTPGLVDSHTHPAFATTREDEFEMRATGMSYQEIAKAGGGIRNSVRKLREISEADLSDLIFGRLRLMMEHGTTTVECKSGYGLSTESELKSLRAIHSASNRLPIRTLSTFLGAHEVPDEFQDNKTGYINLLIHEMIPKVAGDNLADFCDVFCEEGVFTVGETRKILEVAQAHGLELKFHADEFISTGGAELAAGIQALSADHLMAISEEGIRALAISDTVATLLPGTTFFLGTGTWAPARKMLESGVTLALATDFNPGSNMSLSMSFIMTLAVIYLKMTSLEAFQAATYGGAKALGLSDNTGAIAVGYTADAVIWSAFNYKQVPYYYGINQVAETVIQGNCILKRQ